jgi:prevent-host-death family protein
MDSKRYSIAESKNRLPAIIHEAEKSGPIFIHRRGKAVAVLLSIDSYQRLQARSGEGFFQAYTRLRSKWDQQRTKYLESRDVEDLRDQSSGRDPSL